LQIYPIKPITPDIKPQRALVLHLRHRNRIKLELKTIVLRSASADGNLFPWIFNVPATYWDGASAFIRHAADVEGGFDKLKGKKIGLVYARACKSGIGSLP
jgi:hypothetical protein